MTSQKILILMRHANAENASVRGVAADRARPLTEQGRHEAFMASEHLRNLGIKPKILIHSPAIRIVQTVEGILPAWDEAPHTEADERLYNPSYTHEDLVAYLTEILEDKAADADCAMVVTHNPFVADLVYILSKEIPSAVSVNYPSGTIAILSVNVEAWSDLRPESCICEKLIIEGTHLVDLMQSHPAQATLRAPAAE